MGGRPLGDPTGGNPRSPDGSLGADSCLWPSTHHKGLSLDIEARVAHYRYRPLYDKYVKLFSLVDLKVTEFNNDGP